jgi:hypothetical protein
MVVFDLPIPANSVGQTRWVRFELQNDGLAPHPLTRGNPASAGGDDAKELELIPAEHRRGRRAIVAARKYGKRSRQADQRLSWIVP